MALSSRTKNKFMDSLNLEIDRIANWRMPKSSRNNEGAAWKLFISHHLLSRANKIRSEAEEQAIRGGVIFDKEKNPRPGGTREVIYNGDLVMVMCEVRKASERIDTDALIKYLSAAGVDQSILDEGIRLSTKMTKPAHVFTTMLVTEEANGK